MLQISKKVEYGLIALRYIAMQPKTYCATTKEISTQYGIPFNILAKVMQQLARGKIILPRQGIYGGYFLIKKINEIFVSDVIKVIEKKNKISLMQCEGEKLESCIIASNCTIKNPLLKIQSTINDAFAKMTIKEIL